MTIMANEEMERLSLEEEAEMLTERRRAYEIVRDLADDMQANYKQAEARLNDHMEARKVKGIKVGDINYVPAQTTYISFQDKDAFIDWAVLEGHEEYLKPGVNKEAINEEMRRRLDDGEPLPPGVGFYVKEYISQRAA